MVHWVEERLDVGSSQGSSSIFRGQCFSSVLDYGISSDLVRRRNVRENVTDAGYFREVLGDRSTAGRGGTQDTQGEGRS